MKLMFTKDYQPLKPWKNECGIVNLNNFIYNVDSNGL